MSQIINHDKHLARYGYESLVLQQPHIKFDGLWTDGTWYFAVCPSLAAAPQTADGEPLTTWFHEKCRPICSPLELVEKAPPGTTSVPERTAEELSQLHGEPLTDIDLYRELSCAVGSHFPLLSVESRSGTIDVFVARGLSDDEMNELIIALNNHKIMDADIRIASSTDGCRVMPVKGADGLALISSRAFRDDRSALLRRALEDDEEFWVDHRLELFTSGTLRRSSILPSNFLQETSSCFIDASVFSPQNIRAFLPIYRRVIIAMPLAGALQQALQSFGVTKVELIELVRRGRVQFVLPQSLERYSMAFVTEVLEANPSSIILSRRLAAATISETQTRVPLLYPPFGTKERRRIVEMLASTDIPEFGPLPRILGKALGDGWVGMELNLSTRGAMGTMSHGIGGVLAATFGHFTGRDLDLELTTTSMPVEWAAALQSTYVPYESAEYSTAPAAMLCASVYSGVRNVPLVNPIKDVDVFVGDLLTLDNDAPVLEIDQVFTPAEIDRLGSLFRGINPGPGDSIDDVLHSLNDKIRRYEANQNRLKRLDVMSLAGAAAGILADSAYVSVGVWIAQYIFEKADPSLDVGGTILDWMRAANSRTSADVVLVSRIRDKLHGLSS